MKNICTWMGVGRCGHARNYRKECHSEDQECADYERHSSSMPATSAPMNLFCAHSPTIFLITAGLGERLQTNRTSPDLTALHRSTKLGGYSTRRRLSRQSVFAPGATAKFTGSKKPELRRLLISPAGASGEQTATIRPLKLPSRFSANRGRQRIPLGELALVPVRIGRRQFAGCVEFGDLIV